jgi:NAD(P)-dependent dehydrogenase (short-subunit alcohol dehydrogenase family)
MTVGICGAGSSIAKAFMTLIGDENVVTAKPDIIENFHDRYFFCTGYLAGKQLCELSEEEAFLTWQANFMMVAKACDRILLSNPTARICVIGSESAFKGSYDMAYAGSKIALHKYVETKQLTSSGQFLVAVAPHVVWDSGMTQKRRDLIDLKLRGGRNRTGRWLEAIEVAKTAHWLLYDAPVSLSGQTIRMRP